MADHAPQWRDIFKAFPAACDVRKMFLGLGWLAMVFVGLEIATFLMAKIVLNGVSIHRSFSSDDSWSILLYFYATLPFSEAHATLHGWQFDRLFAFLSSLYDGSCWGVIAVYAVFVTLWSHFWWLILGGAIHRSAVVEIAAQDRISLQKSLQFSFKRMGTLLASPTLIVFCLSFLIGVNGAVGFMAQWLQDHIALAVGSIFLAIFWGVLLIANLLAFFLLLALFLSSSLMVCAVAWDGLDHYDAVSRGIMYCFHRIWHFLFYHLVALLYAIPTACFVVGAFFTVWGITCWSVRRTFETPLPLFPWDGPVQSDFHGILFQGVSWFYFGLIAGFLISFYACLKTVIYALLRHQIEGVPLERYHQV